MNDSFHIDIPIIGPRTAIVPIGKAGDPQAIDIITEHPVALSTPHPANDGGNLGRKELDHHLPCTVHDDGAGSVRAIVEGFSIKGLQTQTHMIAIPALELWVFNIAHFTPPSGR
jgi:hypothetical protein